MPTCRRLFRKALATSTFQRIICAVTWKYVFRYVFNCFINVVVVAAIVVVVTVVAAVVVAHFACSPCSLA